MKQIKSVLLKLLCVIMIIAILTGYGWVVVTSCGVLFGVISIILLWCLIRMCYFKHNYEKSLNSVGKDRRDKIKRDFNRLWSMMLLFWTVDGSLIMISIALMFIGLQMGGVL